MAWHKPVSLIFYSSLLILAVLIIPNTAGLSRDVGEWPGGYLIITKRVVLQEGYPFVELGEDIISYVPVLGKVLENASFWVQRNMNETQHWEITADEILLIRNTLAQMYEEKYGLNSSEYAELYNTTFVEPVVLYSGNYFVIIEGGFMTGVTGMLIYRVYPIEDDAFVEWNGSVLESLLELRTALDTAVAWVEQGIEQIVYFFDNYSIIMPALDFAYNLKYGMDWFEYFRTYNTSIYKPVVAYDEYYFAFDNSQPLGEAGLLPSPWFDLVAIIAIISVILLVVTLMNFRQLRSELRH